MYLYIASRPHSGSTILAILLGNTSSVQSVGQLVSDMGKLDNACACGTTIRACPFWQEVRDRVGAAGVPWDEAVRASVGQAHVRRFWPTLRASADNAEMERLARTTHVVATAIAATAGKRSVLDSTKEPTRGLFLARFYPETRLVRLVRDPRSTVASHYWRLKEKRYFHFLRRNYRVSGLSPLFLAITAASWTLGNALHEIAASRARGRVVTVRYEDLRDRPEEELTRIGAALGIDVAPVVELVTQGAILPTGHIIGGNAIRFDKGLRFDPRKEKTRGPLPHWVELLTVALCWPLMGRYGYSLRR